MHFNNHDKGTLIRFRGQLLRGTSVAPDFEALSFLLKDRLLQLLYFIFLSRFVCHSIALGRRVSRWSC